MMRREIGKDTQLQVRMFITMFLLGMVYVAFIVALWRLGAGVSVIVVLAVVMAAVQFFLSDRMVLLATSSKLVSREQEPELHEVIERLAQAAGVPKPKIGVSSMPVPNAFAAGRSAKTAIVVVTARLRELLSEQELEAVLAHEMSHIKHRDVVVMTYASFFSVVASTLMHMFFWMGLFGGFSSRRGHGGGTNVIMLAYVVTIVVWVLSQVLLAALSRYREFAADRGAAMLTGRPADLSAALTRISGSIRGIPQDDLRKAESMNAFYIMPAIGHSIASLFPPTLPWSSGSNGCRPSPRRWVSKWGCWGPS